MEVLLHTGSPHPWIVRGLLNEVKPPIFFRYRAKLEKALFDDSPFMICRTPTERMRSKGDEKPENGGHHKP